jgi:curved DNA-binding protein CbpA
MMVPLTLSMPFLLVIAILISVIDSLVIDLPGVGIVRHHHINQLPLDRSTGSKIFSSSISRPSRFRGGSFVLSQLQSTADANANNAMKNKTNHKPPVGNDLMFEKTFYQVLQVETNATRDEIKKSYFRLAKQSHPDALIDMKSKPKNDDDEATIDFQEIAEAWKILGNSKLRRRYDRELQAKEWSLKAQAYTNERLEQAVPVVADMMDNIAVPFLRRTTATTWAVGQAIAMGVSGFSRIAKKMNRNVEQTKGLSSNACDDINRQTADTQQECLENTFNSAPILVNGNSNTDFQNEETTYDLPSSEPQIHHHHEPIGLTDTFLQALELGRQVAREMESLELNEKAEQVQERYVIFEKLPYNYCCSIVTNSIAHPSCFFSWIYL